MQKHADTLRRAQEASINSAATQLARAVTGPRQDIARIAASVTDLSGVARLVADHQNAVQQIVSDTLDNSIPRNPLASLNLAPLLVRRDARDAHAIAALSPMATAVLHDASALLDERLDLDDLDGDLMSVAEPAHQLVQAVDALLDLIKESRGMTPYQMMTLCVAIYAAVIATLNLLD